MMSWYLCIICICCILFYVLYLQPTHAILNFGRGNCLLNLLNRRTCLLICGSSFPPLRLLASVAFYEAKLQPLNLESAYLKVAL